LPTISHREKFAGRPLLVFFALFRRKPEIFLANEGDVVRQNSLGPVLFCRGVEAATIAEVMVVSGISPLRAAK
jgi:hypothetical protein